MILTDKFTTQFGSWEINSTYPFGVDKEHRERYRAGGDIPPAGADHHIIVKAPVGTQLNFVTSNGEQNFRVIVDNSGWANFPMSKDSGYDPDKGEVGPWNVYANGAFVKGATGIGMPHWWHVSTFLVIEEGEEEEQPQPVTDKIVFTVNGKVLYSN